MRIRDKVPDIIWVILEVTALVRCIVDFITNLGVDAVAE